MARLKSAWDKLSMRDRALFIRLGVLNGVSSLKEIRDTYNLYKNGGLEEILNKVNSSNANFVQRLKDSNRKNIPDWEFPDRISTHKLSVGTDENGNHYIFPEVQEINGELIDFTRPPYHRFAGELSAEMRGDTVRVSSLEDAIKFTESYKQYYPFNNGGNLIHKKSGKELGESQDLSYPNLLPEVEVHPKWYDLEWTKRTAAGLSALGTIATYIPNPYAKAAGLIAQIPDMYYDTRSLVSDVKNTDNWIDESLNTLILDPFFRKKRPLIEQLGKGADYLGPFKKINIPLSALDAVNDGYYAITGNRLLEDVLSLVDNKKSTGGPLYPFSFEKNPFLKTPVVRYDEGGQKQDASNPGGYTDEQLNNNYLIWKTYDPTGGLNFFNYIASQNSGNLARGEENEYWKEYLGLDSAVPLMNSNAYTEWDKQIEGEKKQNGELTSDFYGTTPRMDYNILALADTLMLGDMVRNYAEYDKTYDLPHIETITEAYELAKNILNNPNQWTYVNGEIPIGRYRYDSKTSETNPLGMLSHFGMKWVPEENALYMHDTYDFPNRVHKLTDIPVRPREMKIRSRINFDPTKGSWLLRNPVNYNANIPIKVTK